MKIAIIGGSGGMGKLFLDIFKNNFTAYAISRTTEDYQGSIEKADIICISVPIDAVTETLKKIRQYNLSNKLVINFASNMEESFTELQKLPCTTCCMHALFGPDIRSLKKQNIIIAPTITDNRLKELQTVLEKEGAMITFTTPTEHDRTMGFIQALSQFSSIALARSLTTSHIPKEKLETFSSVSFRLNAAAIDRILMQPAELWYNIQAYNTQFPTILEKHLATCVELQQAVLHKDKKKFEQLFVEAQDFWNTKKDTLFQETKTVVAENTFSNSIAVLGPKGTFSHQAAVQYNGALKPIFFETIEEVIKAVSEEKIAIGIVPIENSTHGTIVQTIDGIYQEKLQIQHQLVLSINQCIAGLQKNSAPDDIEIIFSHPQAIHQSKKFIQEKYPHAKIVLTPSTAAGFEKISDEGLAHALVIGPKIAAETYKLHVLAENIQDEKNNQTAFVVIGKKEATKNATKTMLVLKPTLDKPGLLAEILESVRKKGINLSKIESRPSREKLGTYIFYVTLDTADKEIIENIRKDLAKHHVQLVSLGSFSV